MIYEKKLQCFYFLWLLLQDYHSVETCSLDLTFRVLFNFWSKDAYLKEEFGLSNFEILPLIAIKVEWFIYFKIAASTGSKIFKLKPFVFSLGKLLLVTVSKFLAILLK